MKNISKTGRSIKSSGTFAFGYLAVRVLPALQNSMLKVYIHFIINNNILR